MDGLGYFCDIDGMEIAGELFEIPIPPSGGASGSNDVVYACSAHAGELEDLAARWWAHWALRQVAAAASCN
jgi:hypothetical protein